MRCGGRARGKAEGRYVGEVKVGKGGPGGEGNNTSRTRRHRGPEWGRAGAEDGHDGLDSMNWDCRRVAARRSGAGAGAPSPTTTCTWRRRRRQEIASLGGGDDASGWRARVSGPAGLGGWRKLPLLAAVAACEAHESSTRCERGSGLLRQHFTAMGKGFAVGYPGRGWPATLGAVLVWRG